MQEADEVGKWCTDGKHTYPYCMHLDPLLKNGTLQMCDKPPPPVVPVRAGPIRTVAVMTLDERETLAGKLNISVGDLGNMSPQELAEAEREVADMAVVSGDLFAKA